MDAGRSEGLPVATFRLPAWARWTQAIVIWAVTAFLAVGALSDGGPATTPVVVATALATVGGVMGWRFFRCAVFLYDQEVVIRGLLWNRAVPRASIEGMTPYPSLLWRDVNGRSRKSPVTFLAPGPRTAAAIARAQAKQRAALARALRINSQGRRRPRR